MSLQIVILAAGKGTRMYSHDVKVLQKLAGKPMLQWVIERARLLNPDAVHVIVGHQSQTIVSAINDNTLNWVEQAEQLGTGHAVMQALPYIDDKSYVLVLSGDVPLIDAAILQQLIHRMEQAKKEPLVLLTAKVDDPSGLGRIIRDKEGYVQAIVEEKDAGVAEKQINEIYSGICCAPARSLKQWLPKLSNKNAQGEYYLTEIIQLAVAEGCPVEAVVTDKISSILGVNNRLQLHQLERLWQKEHAQSLLLAGLSLADANRFDVRGILTHGKDVFIDVNVVIEGQVSLDDGVHIGPNCVLKDCHIGNNSHIHANSVIEGALIGHANEIGPFARVRPGTVLANHCKIGNFVETKKATFADGSKASHLSYLGDVTIGSNVNIGAGTITCNYDGVNKYQTIIEDGAFIGSDTQLIAPVTVGKNATIGAGSTIRKDAPPDALTLSASVQRTLMGWKRPQKKEKNS
jgi:bifunctional UDP-N-acetylglucosamine pyrophosphorylase/glucosamine-1-phosphate N-acetyltransferase